jgi:hypothetical protein
MCGRARLAFDVSASKITFGMPPVSLTGGT